MNDAGAVWRQAESRSKSCPRYDCHLRQANVYQLRRYCERAASGRTNETDLRFPVLPDSYRYFPLTPR